MNIPYTPPEFIKTESATTSFNCPHCNAFSAQSWHAGHYKNFAGDYGVIKSLTISVCHHCKQYSLWQDEKMVYPDTSGVLPPNADLPDDIQTDYIEARSIVTSSPRGAAALLRLCIQKICIHLGEPGKNLNTDIGNLVKKGLSKDIQKAFDILRVKGNNAVHPGEINLKDNQESALRFFKLVNFIAEEMITRPNELEKFYEELPAGAKEAIEKRDGEA